MCFESPSGALYAYNEKFLAPRFQSYVRGAPFRLDMKSRTQKPENSSFGNLLKLCLKPRDDRSRATSNLRIIHASVVRSRNSVKVNLTYAPLEVTQYLDSSPRVWSHLKHTWHNPWLPLKILESTALEFDKTAQSGNNVTQSGRASPASPALVPFVE